MDRIAKLGLPADHALPEQPLGPVAVLTVSVSDSLGDALDHVLADATPDLDGPRPVAIVAPRELEALCADPVADRVRRALNRQSASADVVLLRPPGRTGAVAALAREAWRSVPTGPGAERFASARVPERLTAAELVVVTSLPPLATSDLRPIALLARFADPRQVAVARIDSTGVAAAELAAAIRPRLTVMVGTFGRCFVAMAAGDLLTSELAWTAFKDLGDAPSATVSWQAPVVQRLAQLDVRERHTDELRLRVLPTPGTSCCANEADRLEAWLARKLGVDVAGNPATQERSPLSS